MSSALWPGWTWWLAVTDLDVLLVCLSGCIQLSDLVGHETWLLLTLMSSLFASVDVFSSLTWLDMKPGCYWPWCPPCLPQWMSSALWPGWTWSLVVTDLDVLLVCLSGCLQLPDLVGDVHDVASQVGELFSHGRRVEVHQLVVPPSQVLLVLLQALQRDGKYSVRISVCGTGDVGVAICVCFTARARVGVLYWSWLSGVTRALHEAFESWKIRQSVQKNLRKIKTFVFLYRDGLFTLTLFVVCCIVYWKDDTSSLRSAYCSSLLNVSWRRL